MDCFFFFFFIIFTFKIIYENMYPYTAERFKTFLWFFVSNEFLIWTISAQLENYFLVKIFKKAEKVLIQIFICLQKIERS